MVDETDMSKPCEVKRVPNSSKFSILLPLRVVQFPSFHYETPCKMIMRVYGLKWLEDIKSKKAVKIGGFLSAAQQTVTSKKNIAFRDESCSVNALPYVFELQTKRLAARQSGRLSSLPDITQFYKYLPYLAFFINITAIILNFNQFLDIFAFHLV